MPQGRISTTLLLCMALHVAMGMSVARGMPLLQSGEQLPVALDGHLECDTGGRLWPSAIVHCRWQLRLRAEALHVLELSCDTDAVRLFAAAFGAESVVLTDGGSDTPLTPLTPLTLAAQNAEDNRALFPSSEVDASRLAWGTAAEFGPFERVYATYIEDAAPHACELQVVLAPPSRERLSNLERQTELAPEPAPELAPEMDERLTQFEPEAAKTVLAG